MLELATLRYSHKFLVYVRDNEKRGSCFSWLSKSSFWNILTHHKKVMFKENRWHYVHFRLKCLGNHGNHKNFDLCLISKNFWLIFMEMKQKKFFFWKTKFKMADSKKVRFSKSPILNIFLWKFHGLVLGLVGLNDAKGINLAQSIWPWGSPT